MNSDEIKILRTNLGYSQQEFAALLNVSFATVNRWENGKAQPQKDRLERIRAIWQSQQEPETSRGSAPVIIPRLNFEGDAEAVKLIIKDPDGPSTRIMPATDAAGEGIKSDAVEHSLVFCKATCPYSSYSEHNVGTCCAQWTQHEESACSVPEARGFITEDANA
jgi:transcriptional regulator with XRE-family HTH domain